MEIVEYQMVKQLKHEFGKLKLIFVLEDFLLFLHQRSQRGLIAYI